MAIINGDDSLNDDLLGGAEDDQINGLGGNDILEGGAGNNTLDGGDGNDTVSYASAPVDPGILNGGVNVDLSAGVGSAGGYGSNTDTLISIENAIGSDYNDVFTGSDGNNQLDGGDGDDYFYGGLGDDTLIGGNGTDTVQFMGNSADYTVQDLGGGLYRFTHAGGGGGTDGIDILSGIENLSFSDGMFDFATFVACFMRGTRVLTRAGYVPVESLRPGDEVRTLKHGWRPVQWLGQRHIPRNAAGGFDHEVQPIRIVRGAFGAGLPGRDLWLSPNHAVYFRDHLIPAKALVNGGTVIREADVEAITYYHVLLDRHAVVFSEGLPTESYSPQENIDQFENADTCPEPRRNSDAAIIGLLADCLPRVAAGPVVETARALLARMAPERKAAQARVG